VLQAIVPGGGVGPKGRQVVACIQIDILIDYVWIDIFTWRGMAPRDIIPEGVGRAGGTAGIIYSDRYIDRWVDRYLWIYR